MMIAMVPSTTGRVVFARLEKQSLVAKIQENAKKALRLVWMEKAIPVAKGTEGLPQNSAMAKMMTATVLLMTT